MEWFRWYHGTINDPKLSVVARISGQPKTTVLAVWQAILECVSQDKDRGCLGNFDQEDVAMALETEVSHIAAIYQAMEQKKMIGSGRVINWLKRQPRREDDGASDRKRNQREVERLTAQLATVTAQLEAVTQGCAVSNSMGEDDSPAVEMPPEQVVDQTKGEEEEEEKSNLVLLKPRMPVREACRLLERYFGRVVVSGGEMPVLEDICRRYPPERINAAFEAAGAAGATRLRYVSVWLENPENGRAAPADETLEQFMARIEGGAE